MNIKRIVAIIAVITLILVSVGVNFISIVFTKDVSSLMDKIQEETNQNVGTTIVEKGDTENKIALLSLDGAIQDTGAAGIGLSGAGYNHQFMLEQLKKIKEDDTVKGIVFEVNSPGGGVIESDEIYTLLKEIQAEREIPYYVVMGNMAASGGYYISAPADQIFVSRETITGSLGVIMQSLNYSKLAEKVGISFNTIKSGEFKDMMSPNREMTDAERAMLQDMLNDSYERFVEIIADGRNMSTEQVKKIADGRIMNGRQAIEAKLADQFGKTEDAIEMMKEELAIERPHIFKYEQPSWTMSLFGFKAKQWLGQDIETQLLTKLLTENSAPRMMYIYGEQ